MKTHTHQLRDTLLEVQQEYERLRKEHEHLKAELDYERGWRAKTEEALSKYTEVSERIQERILEGVR